MKIDINKFPYKNIRQQQKIVIDKINNNKNFRYYVLECPTGSGKSALAKTICESTKNSYILTATKQLQDQYVNDFPFDIETIKGKSNYICGHNSRMNCDTGQCLINKNLNGFNSYLLSLK